MGKTKRELSKAEKLRRAPHHKKEGGGTMALQQLLLLEVPLQVIDLPHTE